MGKQEEEEGELKLRDSRLALANWRVDFDGNHEPKPKDLLG